MSNWLLSRRALTGGLAAAAALAPPALAPPALAQAPLIKRPIPQGSGETMPIVGLGTAVVFNAAASSPQRSSAVSVVRALVDNGGTLIDTAPSYGAAEGFVGEILTETALRPRVFISTKLEEYRPGDEEAEAQDCLRRLKTDKVDLLQLHNTKKADQDMGGLNALKAKGLCRYTGVSTTFERDYAATEAIVRRARPHFLEIDYALDNRKAEERLLPAARDSGTAVLVALPFGRGRLFKTALGKPLPDWAKEFDCTSWGQFFLKFVVSHPAITAAIPGTSNPQHMIDNLGAARGKLPDEKMRARMIQYVEQMG